MVTQVEHAAALAALKDQVVKSRVEVLKKIQTLEEALNNNTGEIGQEVTTAFEALKAEVQVSDDIVPDEPVTP